MDTLPSALRRLVLVTRVYMFGYVTDETTELMPLSHVLATKLEAWFSEVRKNDELRSFDKSNFLDLGHPLLNRITESFIKAAKIDPIGILDIESTKKQQLPDGSLEAMVKIRAKSLYNI
ncbi:hypothetical protein NE237_031890 [Protea cynaroides]|uniref:S-adenosylmethionine synthetase central domain-containing protein n=1 Tax=Protea cynaroides TaxID=273540 RepID=A0A9Q0L220_9MAGN|nr:hypothetical protein NE237_031890 [Protea cynaroides]